LLEQLDSETETLVKKALDEFASAFGSGDGKSGGKK